MPRRRAAVMLAAAFGTVLVLPIGWGTGILATAIGLENAQDAHGFEGLAFLASVGLAFLAWLLAVVTSLLASVRPAAQGRLFWAWTGLVAIASLVAAGFVLEIAWSLRTGFVRDSVVHGALALWTAAAGVVAVLWLPWGGRVPEAGIVAR